jgi:hypothetical protein
MERDEDWDEDQDEDGKRRVLSQAPSGFSESLNIQYPTRNFLPLSKPCGAGACLCVPHADRAPRPPVRGKVR